MKVLTIKEPWASLIINGYKVYEFRTWKTNYRGKFLVHAAKGIDKKNLNRFKDYNIKINPGHILGEAEITDCIYSDEKFHKKLLKLDKEIYKNSVNEYAFKLDNIKKYNKQIEVKGKLGFWEFNK